MTAIRSIATVVGFAAITSVACLAVFWPRETLADDDDTAKELTLDGTRVKDDVVVTGELVQEPKAKSGWVMQVEAENRGRTEATAELETDLTRVTANPASRASPMPTAIFKKKEAVTLAAGEKVTRRYDVPASLGGQLTANHKAEVAREKAMEAGKDVPMPRSVTYFGVAFKGPWSDDFEAPTVPSRRALRAAL